MAFFKKLKDRLFKSSSKIDEGLEAIVDDGGVEETIAAAAPVAEKPAPTVDPTVAPTSPEIAAPLGEAAEVTVDDVPAPDAFEPRENMSEDAAVAAPVELETP